MFRYKKTLLKIKNSIFQPKYVRYKISVKLNNRLLKIVYELFSFLRYLEEKKFFLIMETIRKLQKCIQKIEREARVS